MKFLILLLLISCKNQKEEDLSSLLYDFNFIQKIISINKNLIEGAEIKEPQNTWQFIFKVNQRVDANTSFNSCLFYYVPGKGETGKLKIIKEKVGLLCENQNLETGDLTRDNISPFAFKFGQDFLFFFISKKSYKIHLFNLIKEKDKPKLFDSYPKKDFILNLEEVGESLKITKNKISNNEYCHKLKDNCEEEISYQCDQCDKSIFTIEVSSNCRKGYNKRCGDITCGGVLEPACVRGFSSSGLKTDFCFEDSPVGFCHAGLRVHCKDHILICNY